MEIGPPKIFPVISVGKKLDQLFFPVISVRKKPHQEFFRVISVRKKSHQSKKERISVLEKHHLLVTCYWITESLDNRLLDARLYAD